MAKNAAARGFAASAVARSSGTAARLGASFEEWMDEYGRNIHPAPTAISRGLAFCDEPQRTLRLRGSEIPWQEDDLYTAHEQIGLDDYVADRCLLLAPIATTDLSFVDRVRELGVTSDLLETGLSELAAVVEGATASASMAVFAAA